MNYCTCVHVYTYSLVARLVAVVASGQVPYSRNSEAATFSGIRVFLATVGAQALKQAADHILVMADEIGVLTDVVAVPDNEEERESECKSTAEVYIL